jgi:NTE family protein
VLQATLLDRMAEDVRSLRRTNALVAPRGPAIVARNGRPYRVVDHVYLGPPNAMVIRETAERVFRKRYGGVFSRWSDTGTIGRLIGGSPQSRGELLSFLFFDPHFHDELIELGRRHAGAALGPGPGIPWRT